MCWTSRLKFPKQSMGICKFLYLRNGELISNFGTVKTFKIHYSSTCSIRTTNVWKIVQIIRAYFMLCFYQWQRVVSRASVRIKLGRQISEGQIVRAILYFSLKNSGKFGRVLRNNTVWLCKKSSLLITLGSFNSMLKGSQGESHEQWQRCKWWENTYNVTLQWCSRGQSPTPTLIIFNRSSYSHKKKIRKLSKCFSSFCLFIYNGFFIIKNLSFSDKLCPPSQRVFTWNNCLSSCMYTKQNVFMWLGFSNRDASSTLEAPSFLFKCRIDRFQVILKVHFLTHLV